MKPPAKTAAERQKAYRERRAQEAGEQRINTWVAAAAVRHLNALALRHGLTQKVMLERLILAAGKPPAAKEKPAVQKDRTEPKLKSKSKSGLKPGTRDKRKDTDRTSAKRPVKAQPAAIDAAIVPAQPVQASLWDD